MNCPKCNAPWLFDPPRYCSRCGEWFDKDETDWFVEEKEAKEKVVFT